MHTLKEFWAALDWEHPSLAGVKAKYDAGDEAGALAVWRRGVAERLRPPTLDQFGWHGASKDPRRAEWLLGRMTDAEFAEATGQESFEDVYRFAGPPDRTELPEWLAFPDFQTDMRGKVDYPSFEFFIPLAAAFQQSGDAVYLEKWFEIAGDFCTHHRAEMEALDREERMKYVASWTKHAASALTQGWRGRNILRCLAVFAKALPEGNQGGDWMAALDAVETPLADHADAVIPAEALALITLSLYVDHTPEEIEAYRNPGYTPNQRYQGLVFLGMLAAIFPEFKQSENVRTVAAQGVANYVDTTALPDGGDLEQSFNYNRGLLKHGDDLLGLYDLAENPWLQDLEKASRGRRRMFAAIALPTGGTPVMGTMSLDAVPAFWRDAEAMEQQFRTEAKRDAQHETDLSDPLIHAVRYARYGEANPPPFDSILLPYSGYSALRDGWGLDARYLWFAAPRRGCGHFNENVNSVQLEAFGRMMLVEAGSPYYSPRQAHPSQFDDFEAFREYFNARRSYRSNTILVDGYGQRRHDLRQPAEPYRTPVEARWATTPEFDFTEGFYGDGYGLEADQDVKAIPGSHHRMAIFLKQAGLWLLLDSLEVKGAHTFTQIWHIPPAERYDGEPASGYSEDQVVVDGPNAHTADPGGPNLQVFHCGQPDMAITKYYGARYPHFGWYSAGIAARKVPSVDLHAAWKGTNRTRLATILAPSPGAQPTVKHVHEQAGFGALKLAIETASGGRIGLTWQEAPEEFEEGPLAGVASLALWDERAGAGLVLGAKDLACAGEGLADLPADAIVRKEGATLAAAPIAVPKDFSWEEEGGVPHPRWS